MRSYPLIFLLSLLSLFFFSGCLRQPQPNCVDNDNDGFGSANLDKCPSDEIDCDDSNPNVHPGMAEKCNGIDDDCDGTIDEGCECLEGETKQCGYSDVGICKYGTQKCVNGSWSACKGAVMPQKEICENGIDEDCDGSDASCAECEEVVLERCRCGTEIVESGYCCNGVPSQVPCGGVSRDAIEILRNFPLEENWQREELEECYYWGSMTNTKSLLASFLFSNPDILCTYSPMYGWGKKDIARVAFCVYEKGHAPDLNMFGRGTAPYRLEVPDYTIDIFTPCTHIHENTFIESLILELKSLNLMGKSAYKAISDFPPAEGWKKATANTKHNGENVPCVRFYNPEIECYYVMAGEKFYEELSVKFCFHAPDKKPKIAVFPGQPEPELIKTKDHYVVAWFSCNTLSSGYSPIKEVPFVKALLEYAKSLGVEESSFGED